MKRHHLKTLAAASAAAFLLTPFLMAQDATPAPSPAAAADTPATPAASPGASPATDRMEQFRQRMNERLKTELKATDEEWAVIQPLLEKVQNKMREASPFLRNFGRGGGRPRQQGNPDASPGQSPPPPPNPGRNDSPEMSSLRAALESDSTSPTDIQAKLAALRESRKKATADLEQARQDLVKVLTQRQEATLVLIGILD